MYKKLFILLISIFLITGCSIKKLDVNNYDYLIDNILLSNSKLKNNVFEGYSYYIPKGLKIVNKEENNCLLADKYNNKYYVYVDLISYYHGTKGTYKESSTAYFSKKIGDNDKKKSGYLEINQIKSKYFVEAMYNYVKIEVYTDKDSLSDTIVNVCQILSSTKYNDNVLATTIGDKILNYKEESFNIFTTKKSNTSYLDYIEKYDSGATNDEDIKNDFEDEDVISVLIDEE